ncbi:MAG: hypothetical protein MJK15_09300 [Colwellia sp.]|nr:hypothetical protein [Colwellia sp.]
MNMPTELNFNTEINLPKKKDKIEVKENEVLVLTNGDLRDSANLACWSVQEEFEEKLATVLFEKMGKKLLRAHDFDESIGHGFIDGQRKGSDVFAKIPADLPVIVLLTSWEYSHHIAPSLVEHKGPILILANFDGTWPGLVGALNLGGSLTSLQRKHSRLWSANFDDDFFYTGLSQWFETGEIIHDTSYLVEQSNNSTLFNTEAGKLGKYLGEWVLENKEIMGLFDSFCMGMINGVFPQESLCRIGMPLESLSQSMLVYEMSLVSQSLREECLQFYIDQGMDFRFGTDDKTELTTEQVLEQCAMLIAMARVYKRFGLSCVGVQYQQGLKDICAASDFAEGAIGSSIRFPIPDVDGEIIAPGKPIPCINEVDMGTAIPQMMLFRILESMNLPAETTLHDIRWGSEFEDTFYWDFEISGNVPFEHLKGGIKGAIGHRQPAMYFQKGGSTISGQCKKGMFIWARAHYVGLDVYLHVGTGEAFELPETEYQRRLDSTTPVWPLMNVTLDGINRDELMAGHQSNHITVAYVPEERLAAVTTALATMGLTQGMKVQLAGTPVIER